MFFRKKITTSVRSYPDKIELLREKIETADAIVIGAGAGLSTSAGLVYDGERFHKNFADFEEKYGFCDMYSGGFFPYEALEEYWAYWSRHIFMNRYLDAPKPVYNELFSLIKDKDYFNAVCPVCGQPMTMNLRSDDKFVEDEGWHKAAERYENFLRTRYGQTILFLELGIGYNTPGIIKYPFWRMVHEWKNAEYICINAKEAYAPEEISDRSICMKEDIGEVLKHLMDSDIQNCFSMS